MPRRDRLILEIASGVATAEDVPTLVRRLTEGACQVLHADGAYLEQIVANGDEVEIVATAGQQVPPLGARIPYPGSLANEVIERGAPEITDALTLHSRLMRGSLTEVCADCSALIVPLPSDGRPSGALVLLRSAGQPRFQAEDAGELMMLAHLAAVAFDRALSLERERAARRQMESILESITDGFFVLDREWRFTYANRRAEALLRRSGAELLGANIWTEFPAWAGSDLHEMYQRAVREGTPVAFEEYFPTLDVWFEIRAYPSPEGLSVYLHDVSDRVRAEMALKERERQLRAVLDVLPLPVFIADAEGRFTSVNRAVHEFWGEGAPTLERPAQYVEYRGWWPTTGKQLTAGEWALARALETGEAAGPDEVEVETFRGERRTILNLARPIRDEAGRVVGAVAVNVDITERKALEVARQFLNEAGRILLSSLDYDDTLRHVARLAVPRVADWCAVDIVEEGKLQRLAVVHSDPEKEALAYEVERRWPTDPDAPSGVPAVLRSGKPELFPEIPDALLAADARDEEHLRILREVGMRSVMIVPMRARGHILGAITLISAESGRRYDEADLAFAEQLASRAAVAVDNARLYREAERRAGEERALRRAAAAVTAAFTIEDVTVQIAQSALDATAADGAFIERIDIEREQVELVATAGEWTPTEFTRTRYEGSLAQEVIERGEPLVLENAGTSESLILHEVARACGQCSALAVPLADSGEPIGALVLTRSAERRPFRPDEVARARTFAELASLAFRKVHLL